MPSKRKLTKSSDVAALLSKTMGGHLHRMISSGSSYNEGPPSLPLLEGLVHRPGVADSIVKDAFGRWKAGRIIVRNIELIWKERKARLKRVGNKKKRSETKNGQPPSKRRRKDSKKRKKQQPFEENEQEALEQEDENIGSQQRQPIRDTPGLKSSRLVDGSVHWLFKSIGSPSTRERHVALKILALGCPMDDASIRNLIELIVLLIQEGNAFRDVDATCMVGWLKLLKFLVTRILSGPERLAYCVHPDIGLAWLCRSLWQVSSLSQQEPHPKAGATRVCLSFVEIIHSLVLMGKDKGVYKIHNLLWREKTDTKKQSASDELRSISSLACLVGTYHLLTESHQRTAKSKHVTMMKQLIDPSLLPKLDPRDPFSHERRNDQRLASLLCKINESENKNSPKSTKHKSSSTTSTGSKTDRKKNTTRASSPGGDSAVSSAMESESDGGERSMGVSVASLFRSLYGTNDSENGAGEDQDIVVDFDDDHEIDEEGDAIMENSSDDEDKDDDDDRDENDEEAGEDEVAAGTGDEVLSSTKEVSDSNDEKDNDDDNDDASNDNNSMEEDNQINSEDDEEIDSEEGESMIEVEEHEEDEDEIVIHEDELPQIEQGLLELQRGLNNRSTKPSSSTGHSSTSNPYPTASSAKGVKDRSQLYIKAAMEVLSLQHLPISKLNSLQQMRKEVTPLSISAEKALMDSVMHIVKPEKKPLDAKIILRRAPTQEDFLRNQSKDVVSFSSLKSPNSGNNNEEPTVRDLRQHIANDLQMGDSAEMLEVLLANKILDVDLKLRVVLQTVWKEHLMQHSGGSSSSSLSSLLVGGGRGGSRSFLSSSSGLSLMLYSSLERSMGSSGSGSLSITTDTPDDALPPMVVTYRLTGVDGEATEDTVSTLVDPEAPSESATEEEIELMMEKEYGITRIVTSRRGVFCLLRSVQSNILHILRKIRRDSIGGSENHARKMFKQSFYPGLSLLVCCSKLPSNRKLLLQARAPTTLLRLLLDVLDALEDDGSTGSSESNSTATALQELIEVLASDILSSNGNASSDADEEGETDEDSSTLRLLIQSIKTSSLSKTLRNVIAKLVPYLTYGKPKLSKELASEFMIHVDPDQLGECEVAISSETTSSSEQKSVLMDTFIHASISLPANEVCNSLRTELLNCGFVERIVRHVLRDCPKEPPSWSPSLWSKEQDISKKKQHLLVRQWKEFSKRPGLKTSFEILIGLCKEHHPTQASLGSFDDGDVSFLQFCHWLELTSDNSAEAITMKGFGIHAETLLDDIAEFGDPSSDAVKEIKSLRKKTRNRKKEIAMERRKKTLVSVNKFSAFSGVASAPTDGHPAGNSWAPTLGLLSQRNKDKAQGTDSENIPPTEASAKPDWMKELESMEDETGLTCAVCQEGRKYKSPEMMGLYAYVKKVSIEHGDRANVDGTKLLTNLPTTLPPSLQDSLSATEWHQSGRAVGDELKDSTASSSLSNRNRSNHYTTTVTAGNAIHMSCHARARRADKNHPKAPKSEWEGATLRNLGVNCNVIFPLVSSKSSSVSLFSVEQALAEHQTAVANMIGVRPKSNLWTVLHDLRLMLLRIAYGESLDADCGGGSTGSNAQLIFHQLSMAKMFENEAQVDAPTVAQHARNLSAGFLAACEIASAEDYESYDKSSLVRGIADCSLMAALTCILFHNTKEDYGSSNEDTESSPHPKRRWVIGKDVFLRGLLNCAGCRHALAIHDSGCISTRNVGRKRSRSRSFVEWDMENENADGSQESSPSTSRTPSARKSMSPKINSSRASIDDFGSAIRPMIVFYAMMDQLSSDFVPNHDDEKIEECANRLVDVIQACQKSKSIHELLEKAKITMPHEKIIKELQRGMMAA